MKRQKNKHFLSVIIPTFKQEKTIVKNLQRNEVILREIGYNYEIIVVIDGIVDDTLSRIRRLGLSNLKTIAYKKNQGKTWALRLGLSKASGDWAMFIDAGDEIDPGGISILLAYMDWYNADIIVGSKRHPDSQVVYPLSRKILSYSYYFLVKLLFGIKVRDTQAGIKIFKKKALKKILPKLVEKKFAGDLEMLVVADSTGFKKIFEAPIKLNYMHGPITSAATLKAIMGILIDTMAIFYRKNILKYYQQ